MCSGMRVFSCFLFALAVALQGQPPQQQQPGSLDGQITNSLTGEPVPNATVHLIGLRYIRGGNNSSPETTTQAEGAFHFDSLSPGVYVVTAEHEGFVPDELNTKSAMVTISPGQVVTSVAVSLTPEGTLSGKLEEDDGTAVPGALVQALASLTTRGRTSLRLYSNTHTDKNGQFLLTGLPPNSYYVVADPPDAPQKASKDGTLARTIYPRSLDIDGGSPLPVGAGQSLGDISVRMRRTSTFHIRGKVADALGDTAGTKLKLVISPRSSVESPSLARSVNLGPYNTFDIGGLASGAYTLRLTGAPRSIGRSRALLARQDVDLGGSNLSGVVLTVMPPLTITGQVRVDGSANSTPLPQVSVTGRPLEDLNHSSFGTSRMAPDGSLTFTPIDPGLYAFRVFSGTNGWYVKALTLNQQDILNKPVDLSESTTARLDVVMSPGAGELDGTVQNPDTTAGTTIIVVPANVGPDGAGVLFSFLTRNGTFAVRNVPPGKYLAYAAQRGDPNLWQNPDFLKAIESMGIPVEVDENSRQQIQVPLLSLEQAELVAGRLGLQAQ